MFPDVFLPDVGGKDKKKKKRSQATKETKVETLQPNKETKVRTLQGNKDKKADTSQGKKEKVDTLQGKNWKLKPRKTATCMEKFVIFLTVLPMAGMMVTLITGLDAFNLENNKYLWPLSYVLSFENFLIVTYVYNVVLNPMYFIKFHLMLYNYNFYITHKIMIEAKKKTFGYCCGSFSHCISRCCCICCNLIMKTILLGSALLIVFVVFFISYANIYERAYDMAVIIYSNIIGFTIIILVFNIWLSAHLFLNKKRLFSYWFWGSWGLMAVIFNIMDFDFSELEFTGTTNNLIATGALALFIYVAVVITAAIIRGRLVRFLKITRKKVENVKKDKKKKRKEKKEAKKNKKSQEITIQVQNSVANSGASSILDEVGQTNQQQPGSPRSRGSDYDDDPGSPRHERARSMSSASSVASDIDIDQLLDDEDDLERQAMAQPGGRVLQAKNILLGQLAGFAHQLEDMDDEYAMEGNIMSPRQTYLPDLPAEPGGNNLAVSSTSAKKGKQAFSFQLVDDVSGQVGDSPASPGSKGGNNVEVELIAGKVTGPKSAGMVESPMLAALNRRITVGDEHYEPVEAKESRKKSRRVKCCWNLCICKLPTCWKAINFVNSMAFWMLWGVMFAIGFQRGLMLPVCFFALVVVTWNPLYYSGNLADNYEAMEKNVKKRRLCGICGCSNCCYECCTKNCKWLRSCCSCTPLVCFHKIMYGFGMVVTFLLILSTFTVFLDSINSHADTNLDIHTMLKWVFSLFNYENDDFINNANFAQNGTIVSIIGFALILPLYYVPGVGYLFYHSPISFGFSNFLNAFLCFVLPVFIYSQIIDDDIYITQVFKDTFFEDVTTTPAPSVYFDNWNVSTTAAPTMAPTDDEGYLSAIQEVTDERSIALILVCTLVLVIFLSLAGFSCAYYRFRRALVMSQFKIFTAKSLKQLVVGNEGKMVPLTHIRAMSLTFALLDFISDVMFVTLTEQSDWANVYIQYTAIILLVLQIVVQLVSVYGAISSLRRKFESKGFAYIKIISEKYDAKFKCCFLFDWIFKGIAIIFYTMFMIVLSVMLGLTKLIAIKQVQEWWLHWLILEYKDTLEKTNTAHDKLHNTLRGNEALASLSEREDSVDRTKSPKSGKARTRTVSDVGSEAGDDNNNDDDEEEEDGGCINCIRRIIEKINDQTPDAMLALTIEANVYNAYFVSELIVESLPQLVLNCTNAYYNQSFTTFSIISTAFSAVMILVSVLKFIYFVGFKNLEMREFML